MFWEKLKFIFRKSNKQGKHRVRQTTVKHSEPIRKVDPSHIGDLGEYKIQVQLRQFPKENKYLNDLLLVNQKSATGYSQIDHILITPYGLFVIETKNYKGRIQGKRGDKYWRVNGSFKRYNPIWQNRTHIKGLRGILTEFKDIRIVSVVSFTKRCELYVEANLRQVDADEFVVYDIKLTEFIERKLIRLKSEIPNPMSESDIDRIFDQISSQNITDTETRNEHIQRASSLARQSEDAPSRRDQNVTTAPSSRK